MATPRQFRILMKTLDGAVARALLKAVREKKVVIKDVIEHIDDEQWIAEAISLSEADITGATEEVRDALKKAGKLAGKINMADPEVLSWLAAESSALVTAISEGQREAIREVIAAGNAIGQSPRQTALTIVGRVNKAGVREGGIVGLNGPQGRADANAIYALRSGDPSQMREYLKYTRRDKRFDGIVKAAMKAKKPVAQKDLHKIISRYQARLLKTRADTIARTETLKAVNAGHQQAAQQAVERGDLGSKGTVYKEWIAAHDRRTRDDHRRMDRQRVLLNEPFISPDGDRMMYPGDTSLGADPGATINCRCGMSTVTVYDDQ